MPRPAPGSQTLHYRHGFHAGNFADVFKHTLLCGLLQALNRKDKPWFYLDTHAGGGLYDLGDDSAQRTGEWRDGVGRISGLGNAPEPLATWLRLSADLKRYPGSPLYAAQLARGGDRLALYEQVPEVAAQLRACLRNTAAKWAVHERDGYESHGLLPPAEKRGLVLVDPPFERADEFAAVGDFLLASLARFGNGIHAVWYPYKKRFDTDRFLRRMQRELPRPAVNFVFDNGAAAEGQMRSCGLLVVNPPFRYAEEMEPALRVLARLLSQGHAAKYSIDWIRQENQT